MENAVGEGFSSRRQIQYGQSGQEFETALGHHSFPSGNFVESDLRREKLVLVAFQVPPVAGQLLTGGLQEVAGRTRNNVTRKRAFDADALFSTRLSSADFERNQPQRRNGSP